MNLLKSLSLTCSPTTHGINSLIHTPVPFNIMDHKWVQVKLQRSPITLGHAAVEQDRGCYSGGGHGWPLKRLEPERRAPQYRGPLLLT